MNEKTGTIMSKVILAPKHLRIKLIGDSITHGMGGSNFAQDGAHVIDEFYMNTSGHCWANTFKAHMESQYDCEVVNYGCSGTDIQFVVRNFDTLVQKEDDIVICTIGTNNRHTYYAELQGELETRAQRLQIVYDNIKMLDNLFKKAGKDVIFIANIPSSAENEKSHEDYARIIHMCDINDLYMKASKACGFPFISLYNRFINFALTKNLSVDDLLADGLHPNDAGHDAMYALLMEEFGLGRKVDGAQF